MKLDEIWWKRGRIRTSYGKASKPQSICQLWHFSPFHLPSSPRSRLCASNWTSRSCRCRLALACFLLLHYGLKPQNEPRAKRIPEKYWHQDNRIKTKRDMCETISLEMAFIVLTCLSWFPAGFFILIFAPVCTYMQTTYLYLSFILFCSCSQSTLCKDSNSTLAAAALSSAAATRTTTSLILAQHCFNIVSNICSIFNQTLSSKHNQTIKSMQFMISALESVAQICKILHWANPCGHLSALATLLCYALHFEYANSVDSITHLSEITWRKSVDLDISRRVRFQSLSLQSMWQRLASQALGLAVLLMYRKATKLYTHEQSNAAHRTTTTAAWHFQGSRLVVAGAWSFLIILNHFESFPLNWSGQVEESSETFTDLRGEQAAQAWEWYAYHCWFSNPCCATLRKQNKNSTDLSWTQTLGAKVVATSCHQECTDQSVLLAQKMSFAHVFSPHDLWSSWMLMVSHVQDSSWKSAAGSVATPKGCWTRNGMNTRIEGLTEIQRHRAEMSWTCWNMLKWQFWNGLNFEHVGFGEQFQIKPHIWDLFEHSVSLWLHLWSFSGLVCVCCVCVSCHSISMLNLRSSISALI